jgi:ABC-type multidrug transport system fused ATPase/permease subunit
MKFRLKAQAPSSYVVHRQRNIWRENLLESSDENITGKFNWRLLARFLPYVKRYRGPTTLSIVLMLIFTLASIANPYLIGVAIDNYISTTNLMGLALISGILIAVNLVMWQAQYWQVWTMSWVGQRILYLVSSDMFQHLQQLSLSFYDRTQIGRVMSRLQSDIDVMESMLSAGLLSMLSSVFSLFGIIAAMLLMDVPLALLSFTVLPIMFVIAAFWQRFAQRSFRRTRAAISMVNARLQENISGMRVIQSMAREDRVRSEFDELNGYNRDTNLEASHISALVLPLVEVVAALAIALVVFFGGLMVAHKQLEIGVLVAFTLYINRFFDPIRDLSQQYTQLQRSGVAAERIFQILDVPVEVKDKSNAKTLPPIKGDVEFRDVTFSYLSGLPVLQDLNLHIRPGQTAAFVGATGAGKTTISALLTRFYDVQEGAVLIDGYDVRDVTQQSLRSQIGVVPQDPFLFTGTIRDNIRYGRLSATDAEIEETAKVVGAHEAILHLPEGYDTVISERGRNLSVGQRQLLSFARALLADPRILILDEATASIDTVTEAIVQQGLRRLLEGRTAVVIAHRLSTIKNADLIVALEHGRIIEQGTHDELLAKRGMYAELYSMGFRHTLSKAG